MNNTLSIEIASVPDRMGLVAELWRGNDQVAELSEDEGTLTLQVYKPPAGEFWQFDYENLIQCLADMRSQLLEK